MKATALLEGVYALGLANYPAVASDWVNVMHRLGATAGVAHTLSVSATSKLDIMLRQLESEHWEAIRAAQGESAGFATDLIGVLADSWVQSGYEPIRAACEQARNRKEEHVKLAALHYRLALVRVPIAKAEIKDAKRLKPQLMLHPIGDGPDNSPKPYVADGTYIMPKGVCGETGATVWYPVDLKSNQTVAICRRDLSDEFLALFD